jgi:HTH-type transcriptional regulator, competence development regulator
MAQSAFGVFLRKLREKRGLSLRELAQLANIDHAYVYRLETGEKEAPSAEALTKLVRALKVSKREADMLRYLADHLDVSIGLAEYALEDQTVTPVELTMAASVVRRGPIKRDYKTVIERIRSVLEGEDRG